MPALCAEDLTKRYGERQALGGVSFAAEPGEVLAVVGPNGAGKTTLRKVLAGSLPASGGRFDTGGRRVGWVPQHPAIYSKLSVEENFRLFARLERVPDVDAVVGPHARAQRAARPRARGSRPPFGRQPAAGHHRRRDARRPRGAAARRAVLGAGSAPA